MTSCHTTIYSWLVCGLLPTSLHNWFVSDLMPHDNSMIRQCSHATDISLSIRRCLSATWQLLNSLGCHIIGNFNTSVGDFMQHDASSTRRCTVSHHIHSGQMSLLNIIFWVAGTWHASHYSQLESASRFASLVSSWHVSIHFDSGRHHVMPYTLRSELPAQITITLWFCYVGCHAMPRPLLSSIGLMPYDNHYSSN